MTRQRTPSKSTQLVLSHLCARADYGYALMKETGLKSGTLYPILMRLKDRGYITASWQAPETPGRPPRQIYKITAEGRRYAAAAISGNSQTNLKEVTP